MSLYTPIFPPLHDLNNSQKSSLESSSVAPFGKQQNYVKYLRDLHLFLSTQSDVLSPPSCPASPMFDHRAQKVKDKVRDIMNATECETSCVNWTRASETLKLGCVKGRYWSTVHAELSTSDQDANWILPDEETEWIEWERKREQNRRLKGKSNAPQRIGSPFPTAPDTPKLNHASSAGPSPSAGTTRLRRPPGVSPRTLRTAREKVEKWQASLPGTERDSIGSGPSPAEEKGETARPLRSRTIDFPVIKPAAKSLFGDKKGFLSLPASRAGSVPVPSLPKSLKSTKRSKVQGEGSVDVHNTASDGSEKPPPASGAIPRIANVPETPYLPPSFPVHLPTSTPLSNSKMVVRLKPPPILPASSSTPPPSTPANPPDDLQLVPAEPHVANVSSPSPQRGDAVQPRKRSRESSRPVDDIDPPATPTAKRPRVLSRNGSPHASEHPEPVSPNGVLNKVSYARVDTRDPNPGVAPAEIGLGVPVTPNKADEPIMGAADVVQDFPEKIPTPTKSVKSYFSAPGSDAADSPVHSNLVLESPVSAMLSYAQNPSVFLPQITSTQVGQVRKGSPIAGQTNSGVFGIGYSSQFDVERHVDRVSELLEKDIDFDGWLRDAHTVDISQD